MLGFSWEALSTHLAPSDFHSCALALGTAALLERTISQMGILGPREKKGPALDTPKSWPYHRQAVPQFPDLKTGVNAYCSLWGAAVVGVHTLAER